MAVVKKNERVSPMIHTEMGSLIFVIRYITATRLAWRIHTTMRLASSENEAKRQMD